MPWIHNKDIADVGEVIADQTYYLDKEGNVTTDPEAADRQLAAKGSPIPVHVQKQYSIPTASEEEGSSEKAEKPSANKSEKPTKNKGAK